MFMENRHTYSYMTRGNDLNLMFPEGKRIMPIAFFEKGTSHPRILSKEYQQFEKRVEVAISKESYLYLKPIDSDLLKKEFATVMEINGCMQKKKWKIWNFDRGIGLYDSKKRQII